MQLKRSLAPHARLVITFAGSQDLPYDKQPRVYAQSLALDSQRELVNLINEIRQADDDAGKRIDAIKRGLELCVTGWENITDADGKKIEYAKENFGKVFRLEDAMDLLSYVMDSGRLTTDDKKKSELPPSSDAKSSAPPASEPADLT